MKKLKHKISTLIDKNNSCPFCHKRISFYRKITHHGNVWRIAKCPHCNTPIKVKGLKWDSVICVITLLTGIILGYAYGYLYAIGLACASYIVMHVCMVFRKFVFADEESETGDGSMS